MCQDLFLKIEGISPLETEIINRTNYAKKFYSEEEMSKEVEKTFAKLNEDGYLMIKNTGLTSVENPHYTYKFSLGNKIETITIGFEKISQEIKQLLNTHNEISINIKETSIFLNQIIKKLDENGYKNSSLKLINHKISENKLFSDLQIFTEKQRFINGIETPLYSHFPTSIKNNIKKKYDSYPLNNKIVSLISGEFEQLPFIEIKNNTEILYTENKTALFVYAEKKNINKLDGIIGFSSENNQLKINGNIDLELNNLLDKAEITKLYWNKNADDLSSFILNTQVPYLFDSPLGINAGIEIYRDNAMQNISLKSELNYSFSYNKKIFLGYEARSSTIENNTKHSENYDSWFATIGFSKKHPLKHPLFPTSMAIDTKIGVGERNNFEKITSQYFVDLSLQYLFFLNKRNAIHLQSEYYNLFSKRLIYNEMKRFGGNKSIRGFKDFSILAKNIMGLYTEYRFILSENIYSYSIADFAYYKDISNGFFLYSIGAGVGVKSSSGIFNISYAYGFHPNNSFNFSNSIMHLNWSIGF